MEEDPGGRYPRARGVSQEGTSDAARCSLVILVECWELKPMKWVEEDWEVGRGGERMIGVEGRRDRNVGSRESILERPEHV